MTPKPQGDHRPDSDELHRALRRLADASQAAHCLLDVAADFPHFPGTRDPERLRLVAYLLAGSAAELAELAARLEDAAAPATACPGLHPGMEVRHERP
jgi:hypothetical protein